MRSEQHSWPLRSTAHFYACSQYAHSRSVAFIKERLVTASSQHMSVRVNAGDERVSSPASP